eukprot:jgi/Ulvmu1/11521/UM078_0010.1
MKEVSGSLPQQMYEQQALRPLRTRSSSLTDVPSLVQSPSNATACPWEIQRDDLSVGSVIGKGEFGVVHTGRWHGTPVAIKAVRSSTACSQGGRLEAELEVLCRVRHPHIVQFLGVCMHSEPVLFVSEMMAGGSLAVALQRRRQPPLRRALEVALDCARGLNCLHLAWPHPIIHRDFTPSNVLLSAPTFRCVEDVAFLEHVVAKVADFGLSRVVGDGPALSTQLPSDCCLSADLKTCMSRRGGEDAGKDSGARQRLLEAAESPHSGDTSSGCYMPPPQLDMLLDGNGGCGRLEVGPQAVAGVQQGSADVQRDASGGQARLRAANGDSFRMTGGTGTYVYMAPEICRHKPYNAKADVYSLAMVMYEMLAGRRPFGALDPAIAAQRAATDELRPDWPSAAPLEYVRAEQAVLEQAQALTTRCWAASPSERPTCADVIVELERLIGLLPSQRDAALGQAAAERRSRLRLSRTSQPPRPASSSGALTARRLIHFLRHSHETSTHAGRSRRSEGHAATDSLCLRSAGSSRDVSGGIAATIGQSGLFVPTPLEGMPEACCGSAKGSGGGWSGSIASRLSAHTGFAGVEPARVAASAPLPTGSSSSLKMSLAERLRRVPVLRRWRECVVCRDTERAARAAPAPAGRQRPAADA